MRTTLRRLGLIVFGLALSLVVAEAMLQAGAWYLRASGRQLPAGWLTDRTRVICLGDSHTYGLYLEREQAYPQQLQQQWDGAPRLAPIEVLNLGLPGSNSSRIRANFSEILQTFHPSIVLMMVGANDGWTAPVAVRPDAAAAPTPERPTATEGLWGWSRVFRLFYMLSRAIQNRRDGDLVVTFVSPGDGHAKGTVEYHGKSIDLSFTGSAEGVPDWTTHLAQNLQAIVLQGRAAGVTVVLLTYPTDYAMIGDANHIIHVVAEVTGAPLIDLTPVLAAACAAEGCDGLYLPDFHLTAAGNQIVARTVREQLAGIIDQHAARGREAQ